MVTKQLFVPLPLLRAIEQLPESIDVDGTMLRFTGEVTSAPIVLGFSAYRALVEFEGGVGWVDLSSASSSRTDMSLCAKGLRRARVEQLILEMRAAMVGEQPRVEGAGNDRIEVCRTA